METKKFIIAAGLTISTVAAIVINTFDVEPKANDTNKMYIYKDNNAIDQQNDSETIQLLKGQKIAGETEYNKTRLPFPCEA